MQSSTAVTELPITVNTKTSTIIQDSKRNSKSRYNQAERKQCGQLIRYTSSTRSDPHLPREQPEF